MHQGPTGTDSRTLSVATSDYVVGRLVGYDSAINVYIRHNSVQGMSAAYENQAFGPATGQIDWLKG